MPSGGTPDQSATQSDTPTGLPNITPDLIEQELGTGIDNLIPSFGYDLTPMVGIGGSAGAIRSLQAFFESMPPDSGMVFVVILHLAPDHSSSLAQMIQKWTTMRVVQAEDRTRAEVNTVYVIPPAKHLTATNGHLRLTELDRENGRRVAVDLFFRSLADTHGAHAAAIVLSGADGDGMIGIKRIKERGGLTIAQDPAEAEHDSMPRAAISTGMVDWVLPAAEMPSRILNYVSIEKRIQLPPEDGPSPLEAAPPPRNEPESALRDILLYLRTRTGRDFSYYKRATILRRISRRMQVNGLKDMPSYLGFLRMHPGESGALLKDLLISVTNFFRDRDSFVALEARIPDLFVGKTQRDTIRVWVPACATGEEAYSLAILLLEHARALDLPPGLQVFGCDLDEDAIQIARAGIFPEAIAADVSEERLRHFFVKEHRGYRVRREVREMVLFATHDLLKDAPFSRLDMISCRILLIYLSREAQTRVFEIFHFALKPEGMLFLGSSETIDEANSLFHVVDKKHRIYRRKSSARSGLPVPPGPSRLLVRQLEQQIALAAGRRQGAMPQQGFADIASLALAGTRESAIREEQRVPWSDLHFRLLERFGPPSVLVDREHELKHLSESAGRFLQIVGGTPTTNLLRLVNPALRVELRAALFRATQTGEPAEALQVPIKIANEARVVDLRVAPAREIAPDLLLVTFTLRDAPVLPESRVSAASPENLVNDLEHELDHVKGELRDTVEQYEASTEELKASNEELQAINEELRSATEELETSREELQSINEELSTVNQELKNKVEELGQANSDLQNLMAATAIAIVFLDRDMNIMRFTNSAAPIFNLIPSDLGRPLADLQHRINYPELIADAENVLNILTPVEREVTGSQDRYFLARMLPYRTVDDRIAGVVLTFVDITERQRTLRELTRFNDAAVGREMRMIELKKEVNQLLARIGEPPRYPLKFLKEGGKELP